MFRNSQDFTYLTLLCYVLDDVESVYCEDKEHYRRSNDRRAKPAAFEGELLLVVLDCILAHIERADRVAHSWGHPPVGFAFLRYPATAKEHHIGIEYRPGDALDSETRNDTNDECVITVRIEFFGERWMRAELWFKPTRMQDVMEEWQHPQEHWDRNQGTYEEHDEGDRDFLRRGDRLIARGDERYAHKEAIERCLAEILRSSFHTSEN